MKRFLLILLAAAGAAFLATAGHAATQGIDGQPLRATSSGVSPSIQPSFVGGIYGADTTARVLRFTETGAVFVANESGDRDHWVLQNAGLAATDIAARQIFKSQVLFTAQDYSSIELMVSWAVSDTDSVALEILVVGKQSTNPADGLDFVLDLNPDDAGTDGLLIVNSTAVAASYASLLGYERYYAVPKALNYPTAGIEKGRALGTTVNAVMIPIESSELLNFPVIQVWVINRKNSQMDDVTVDYWAKVK